MKEGTLRFPLFCNLCCFAVNRMLFYNIQQHLSCCIQYFDSQFIFLLFENHDRRILIDYDLSSAICSPHHFLPKRMEENMLRSFNYFYLIIRFPDDQSGAFSTSFASPVNGY